MQKPKHIFKSFQNRNGSFGKERRINALKWIVDKQPHFPKPLTYEDYDRTVFEWVKTNLSIVGEGKLLPTYKLFSNQRISEYGQNWKEVDEKGNIEINFKTVTRENNPQHGDALGGHHNIPGNRKYPVFQTKVLEDNGDEIIQQYLVKQPFNVNLIYSVSIITDKFVLLNEMNTKVLDEFKGLEKYIFPNGYPVAMLLNSISDESDYMIDDRKYYSQTYQIKVLGYIIKEDDFEVKKIPTRVRNPFRSGENSQRGKVKNKFNIGSFSNEDYIIREDISGNSCNETINIVKEEKPVIYDEIKNIVNQENQIEIKEFNGEQTCFPDTDFEMKVLRKVLITVPINLCDCDTDFKNDELLEVENIELNNVTNFKLYINDIEMILGDSSIVFDVDDMIRVEGELKNPAKPGEIKILCFDQNTVVDDDMVTDMYV